jgi:hypothetical protein
MLRFDQLNLKQVRKISNQLLVSINKYATQFNLLAPIFAAQIVTAVFHWPLIAGVVDLRK